MFDFKRFEFRDVRPEEADECAEIERICFPPNEACSHAMITRRAKESPETFLVAFDRVNHKIAGFLNGLPTDEEVFRDEFFTDPSIKKKDGKVVMLLGLDVRPEYRHNNLATTIISTYIDRSEEQGREKLILTCHDRLVSFYQESGFEDLGASASTWGGESWHDMVYHV